MEILYKYRPFDIYVADNINNKRFKMSLPEDTNDFFEGMTHHIDENNEICTFFQTKNNPMSSFSQVFDDMAMWAYYADNHTGVCFEVEVSNSNGFCRYEVQYNDKPLLTKIVEKEKPLFSGDVDAKIPEEILFTKKLQWSHEKEVRYVDRSYYYNFESPQIHYFSVDKIISIIVGNKISDNNMETIKDLCEKNKIKLYRIIPSFKEYKLVRDKISF